MRSNLHRDPARRDAASDIEDFLLALLHRIADGGGEGSARDLLLLHQTRPVIFQDAFDRAEVFRIVRGRDGQHLSLILVPDEAERDRFVDGQGKGFARAAAGPGGMLDDRGQIVVKPVLSDGSPRADDLGAPLPPGKARPGSVPRPRRRSRL